MAIDTIINGRPARRYRRGIIRFLYPCIGCGKVMVVRQGGRCLKCAAKKREENHKKQGIKHPANQTFIRRDGQCAPFWKIAQRDNGDGTKHEVGWCDKGDRCDIKSRALLCRDTLKPCPFNGTRDFTALQERNARRLRALESNRKGGETFKERCEAECEHRDKVGELQIY